MNLKNNRAVKKNHDEKHLGRKLKSKLKRKNRNRSFQGLSKSEFRFKSRFRSYTVIKAPFKFSFLSSTEETIDFINKIEICFSNRTKVFVDLEKVVEIDNSAITVLLSVMNLFKSKSIGFNGNYPLQEDAAVKLFNSGFFKSLYSHDRRLSYTFGKNNQLFTQENKKVVSSLGLPLVLEVSNTVFGEKRLLKGLQRVLLELMQNTNNHAVIGSKGQKEWWLSVNHDQLNTKVSFSFVDYGVGVFESLKSKPTKSKWYGTYEKIKNRLTYGSNEEILRLLLEGDLHLTVTGHHYRGKGIPGMKQVQDRNQISNLHVITNNAFADVAGDNYKKLRNQFSGTFVYWEIGITNQSTEWSI